MQRICLTLQLYDHQFDSEAEDILKPQYASMRIQYIVQFLYFPTNSDCPVVQGPVDEVSVLHVELVLEGLVLDADETPLVLPEGRVNCATL